MKSLDRRPAVFLRGRAGGQLFGVESTTRHHCGIARQVMRAAAEAAREFRMEGWRSLDAREPFAA